MNEVNEMKMNNLNGNKSGNMFNNHNSSINDNRHEKNNKNLSYESQTLQTRHFDPKSLNHSRLDDNSHNYNENAKTNKSNGSLLQTNGDVEHVMEDNLGPLPVKWEKAFTENGEAYFIDHNSGTSHWLDPRLSKFQKKSLEDCLDDELPYGWEKICDPQYGIYFIDHVSRKTQYENPVLQAKRRAEITKSQDIIIENGGGQKLTPFFTKNPTELCGERMSTSLMKSPRGLGFTIVGGDDDNVDEFLQIKSIVPNGPAWMDGNLRTGDILVFVNDICVLGFTHHEMVNVFQSILPGEEVLLDVCRGYALPFDPNDPNTEVVTTIAVDGLNMGDPELEKNHLFLDISHDNYNFLDITAEHPANALIEKNPLAQIQAGSVKMNQNFDIPELHNIIIVKGEMGFGFTIADSVYGQKVKKILDRQCCTNLLEGDILLSINNINIKNLTHNDVVQVLKECPKNQETVLRVQRGLIRNSSKFSVKMRGKETKPMNGMFRSKTPTADLYSTKTKEILPIRPKTPLVDTRARIQTPELLNDLNTDEIELDSKLEEQDNKSTISTATTMYDTSKLLDHMDHLTLNDQRSETYTTTDSINSNSNKLNKNRFFSPLDLKNGNPEDFYGNSNSSVYSTLPPPPLPIPPPNQQRLLQPSTSQFIQPGTQTSTIPYQHQPHDSCYCYDCQDYRIKQQQFGSEYMPYNLPPQMSDNVGKRINEYLLDRKRNAAASATGGHLNGNFGEENAQNNNWRWAGQHPQQYNNSQYPNYQYQEQDFQLSEVTLDRQSLGFGFRIVGGTEEGSQVTVGHIVPDGAADKDPNITTGDEILNINGNNVENASHHRVVQLMGEAGLRGQVTMILRRRNPRSVNYNSSFYQQQQSQTIPQQSFVYYPPYNVIVTRHENEGFGFVIISSSNQQYGSTIGKLIPNSPAERCGELKIGDRIVAVNGIDITNLCHGDVVNLIKESGLQVQLTVCNTMTTNESNYGNNNSMNMGNMNNMSNMNMGLNENGFNVNNGMTNYPMIS